MRSGTIRLGEFLIALGVFVLALQYVNWSVFTPLELADLVIAGGVALVASFGLALWSRSRLFDEAIHMITLVVGALVLGLLVSRSEAATWTSVAGPVRAEKTLSFDAAFATDVKTPFVKLDLVNGSATAQTWESETVQITIRASARAWSEHEAERILNEAALRPEVTAGGLTFKAPRQAIGLFSRIETNIQVMLPRGRVYELSFESVNGEVRVQDVDAIQANLKTVNGHIRVGNLTAERATIQIVNGSVSGGRLSASDVTASTTNGSIDLILGAMTGRYTVSVLNGSVVLSVPHDTQVGYAISARSANGRVRVQVPDLIFSEQERRRVEGESNDFQNAATKIIIGANTTNGDIEIR